MAPLGASNAANVQAGGAKAIEEIYQKKSQLEHILLRPDTYIGSTEKQQEKLWVHDGQRMQLQTVAFVPGLYKIFDEILVNAADNKVRDASMDTVKVQIDVVGTRLACVQGNGMLVMLLRREAKVTRMLLMVANGFFLQLSAAACRVGRGRSREGQQ